jgi:hypothetical protein
MKKSMLQDGTPMVIIKIDHFVKARDFAKHLAEYYWRENEPFPDKLTKKRAMEILKRGLFFNGLHGEIDFCLWEGAFEPMDRFNAIYEPAKEWVKKNYPYLTPTPK